jgi:hypothetical protein
MGRMSSACAALLGLNSNASVLTAYRVRGVKTWGITQHVFCVAGKKRNASVLTAFCLRSVTWWIRLQSLIHPL